MLDTAALTRALSASPDHLRDLLNQDRGRRVAAVKRATASLPEFEASIEEVSAASEAMIAGAKAGRLAPADFDPTIARLEAIERRGAALLEAKRAVGKGVLAFLSENDRTLLDEVRHILSRDEEAATRLCETLRDTRWALMATRAERSPDDDPVEISSADDLRRAMVGR